MTASFIALIGAAGLALQSSLANFASGILMLIFKPMHIGNFVEVGGAKGSVNLVVRPWVNSGDYWPTYFDLTTEIKGAVEKNGLTMPYPQHDVHLKNGALAAATK